MVASYTPDLRLTKQGDDDNPNTWGQVVNNQVITLLEEAIAGTATVDLTGSIDVNIAVTVVNGGSDNARHAVLKLTGTVGASINLVVPSVDKIYIVDALWTNSGGPWTVTVKPSGGSGGIAMVTGDKKLVYVNGTNITSISPDLTPYAVKANNLSDLTSATTARTNLGLGTMAIEAAADYLTKAGNLAGVASPATSFDNIKQAATTSYTGAVELATAAEVIAGTDTTRAITPSAFSTGYASSAGTNGYTTLPGGLILQWGYYTGGSFGPTITFPIAFTTAVYSITTASEDVTFNAVIAVQIHAKTLTTFSPRQYHTNDGVPYGENFYWMAIGK